MSVKNHKSYGHIKKSKPCPKGTKPVPVRYKRKWKAYSLNRAFWKEVLEGRMIVKVTHDKMGVKSLVLDNGETITLTGTKSRLSIVLHPFNIKD